MNSWILALVVFLKAAFLNETIILNRDSGRSAMAIVVLLDTSQAISARSVVTPMSVPEVGVYSNHSAIRVPLSPG